MYDPIEALRRKAESLTYHEILSKWNEASKPADIFSGHLLINLTSEINKIEGIDVSYNRTKEIFNSSFVSNFTGDPRELFSIFNNERLAEFLNESLLKGTKVSIEFIKEIHRILLFASIDKHRYKDNLERAGEFKKHDYSIGKFHVGSTPDSVEEDMLDLCETFDTLPSCDQLRYASSFHCYLENIHPFADGNGRVGRWLLNYMLVQSNHPPIVIQAEDKEEYYRCLERFDDKEELDSMYSFLKDQTVKSYSAYSYIIKG